MTIAPSKKRGAEEAPAGTKRAILEAATELFSTYGLRKTSMEAIAAAAGVAKATLYAYYTSKEAVFADVCTFVADDLQARAETQAARESDPTKAVAASLATKYAEVHAVLHASPHAKE